MALRFIGVDPNTGQGESPTVWVDKERKELVIQGYKPDEQMLQEIHQNPAPEHVPGIPDNEFAVRVPFRMIPIIREACDAADGLG